MRWLHVEHLLKGLFLGLLAYAAIAMPSMEAAGVVALCIIAGLIGGLLVASWRSKQAAIRPSGRWSAYLLFLLLEFQRPIYGGLILGLAVGVAAAQIGNFDLPTLLAAVFGGLALGGLLLAVKSVHRRLTRLIVAIAASVVIVAGAIAALEYWPDFAPEANRQAIGLYLLLGLPFFYLLTFVGEAEETEFEAALWCAALAIGIWLVRVSPTTPAVGLLIPIALFYIYTAKVLPGLRVFKHTLRGVSYGRVGLHANALASLGRAVQLDPKNTLARSALWEVHRRLDPATVDDRLVGLIDAPFCLKRVERLLAEPPKPEEAAEANQLLDLVARAAPHLQPQVAYWRAVAATHAGDFDTAAAQVAPLLQNSSPVEFLAWQLALVSHPALEQRVGRSALAQPGRRLAAIAIVERVLANAPDDPAAWMLKRVLYPPLTEAKFSAGPVAEFDFGYVEQLGRALLEDPSRFHQGAEFLAIAAAGRAADAPKLLLDAADALARHGDQVGAARAREAGRAAGQAVGPKELSDESRHAYFAILKTLADGSLAAQDYTAAAGHLQAYTEYEKSGVETLRTLADCHERRGDPLAALWATAQAMLYNPRDPDLRERRDKYTYSISPESLPAAPEGQRAAVDVDYCLAKAKQLLDLRDADAELIDWAKHLAELTLVMRPAGIEPRLLIARAQLRLGDRDGGLQLLEDIREHKRDDEPDPWMQATKMLGDLYLNELDRPDLAIGCFLDYRKSSRSGADTLYKLAVAYEQLGDRGNAAKFYQMTASYDEHPRAPDAQEGLRRLRTSG